MNADPSSVDRIVGRYRIVRVLGQGAMATVYLAHQSDLDRAVAVKELDRFGVGEPAVFAARFLREARLAGSLSHANIVTVYEYFECDGRPYIAMEYVEGGSLRQHLDGLSLRQVVGVLEELLAALAHAETRGVVHRDIKPENVLVSADGHVKIADFGIARAYGAATSPTLTSPGAAIGTPMYMAPEQATGQPLSIATDLYAVGIVAFEMLFGYVPFATGESPVAIVWQQVNTPLPNLRTLRPGLDPRLCDWLEQLLAKDPSNRPASATRALEELDQIALALLGSGRRRAAPLQPRAAPTCDATPAVSSAAPEAPVLLSPPVLESPPPATPARQGRPGRGLQAAGMALMVVAALAAAVGGYVLFDRDRVASEQVDAVAVSPQERVAAQRFSDRLDAALKRLNSTRASARRRMAAATATATREQLARTVAAAYRVAASGIAQATPPADQRAAAGRVREALVRAGQAYDALADAVLAGQASDYDAARDAIVTRERAVERAVDGIRAAMASV